MAEAKSRATESNDSVGEALPPASDQEVKTEKPPVRPQFGPGSKVNWDDVKTDPNKRKHVGIDPEGKHNARQ